MIVIAQSPIRRRRYTTLDGLSRQRGQNREAVASQNLKVVHMTHYLDALFNRQALLTNANTAALFIERNLNHNLCPFVRTTIDHQLPANLRGPFADAD